MKKTILTTTIMTIASILSAQDKIGTVVKTNNDNVAYMLVQKFETPERNANFQRNISIMKRDSQVIVAIKKQLEVETDKAKKEKLQEQLSIIETNFKTNDDSMKKAFNFASNREYRFIFEETNISIPLTNDELSKLERANGDKIDPMQISKRNGASLIVNKVIKGSEENQELQRTLTAVATRKKEIDALRKELSETTDATKQLETTKKLSAAEKSLKEAEAVMSEKYDIKQGGNYVIETAKSKLYLILTNEELAKIEAQKNAAQAAATAEKPAEPEATAKKSKSKKK